MTLVGATTENPSFTLNGALLSRAQVLVLDRLDRAALETILSRLETHIGRAPMGGEFDGAMAAMDGAASANMAEGMDAANTAADAADAAGADAPADNAPTDDVV